MPTLKLKEDLEAQQEFDNYARILRAIGQDLINLNADDLEIQVVGTEFLASGVGVVQHRQGQVTQTKLLQKTWNRLTGRQSKTRAPAAPLDHESFMRKYTVDDINRVDLSGLAARTGEGGKPDIYSLGERLRTVGRIVDACGGTLVKVVKNRHSMKFEYRDQDGKTQTQEYTNLALYKYQQRYYAERGTYIFIDPWDSKLD